MSSKIRVGVVFGGRSSEHEVSLRSGKSVMEAIDRNRFEVLPIGINKQGGWIFGEAALPTLIQAANAHLLPEDVLAVAKDWKGNVTPTALPTDADLACVEVFFPVLHGTYGEDGAIQGLLEMADKPYVGSGVLGASVGMDKVVFKDVMKSNGIPAADYVHFSRLKWKNDPDYWVQTCETQLGYPVFTKPPNMGSSVGVSKCRNRAELIAGIQEALRFDRKVLVEEGVPNAREIEVGILGNEDPKASVVGEIVPSREFYDYASKYLDDDENASKLLIPSPLPDDVTAHVQAWGKRVFLAVEAAGLARVDFLLNKETNAIYVNEINTLPGFTSISMYPKLWEAAGVPYTALISELIDLAFSRHTEKAALETGYDL